MATVAMAPGLPTPQQQSNETLSTLPDPRSPLTSPDISRSNSTSPHHPELSNEVAALSNKLIHAINHQTDLDDTLNATRHELDAAREHIQYLERVGQEHRSLVANGILIRKTEVEEDTLRLKTNLAEERRQRVQVEKEKKAIEQELETLTTALFEEANQMVSAARKDARKEKEGVERRNEQLQAQLNDAELLLASHQEQLAELKMAMQDMSAQRTELETATNTSTTPSTPALDTSDRMSKIFDALHLSPTTPGGDEVSAAPPTSFSHLLHPVLRTDVQAYEDFRSLLELSRKSQPSSRVTSATYSGLSGLGLGNLTTNREQSQISGRVPSNGSTSSLAASNTHPNSPSTPNLAASTNSSVSSKEVPVSATLLKETTFYKRVLSEDIEPTLRLDTAPGLSWLARRSVINSMCEGKLIVEPMPSMTKIYYPPCSLCGEQGRGEKHARTHRFRTSESDTAQRYPLCEYCLTRVRASCDFLGFLRMIKDGHWRTDGTEQEKSAWEESVRLRERMFWSRIGGGVIPAFLRARGDTPRISIEEEKQAPQLPESQTNVNRVDTKSEHPLSVGQKAKIEGPASVSQDSKTEEPTPTVQQSKSVESAPAVPGKDTPPPLETEGSFQANGNRSSLGRTMTRSRGSSIRTESNGRGSVAKRAAIFERSASEDSASTQLQSSLQASLQSSIKSRSPGRSPTSAARTVVAEPPPEPHRGHTKNTGSIPGAFDF